MSNIKTLVTKDERKAAEGLINLKNHLATGPIGIPKQRSESHICRPVTRYGLNTPSSYEDPLKETNNNASLAATMERNMQIFAEYRSNQSLPPARCNQVNEDLTLSDFPTRLPPLRKVAEPEIQSPPFLQIVEPDKATTNNKNTADADSNIKFIHFQHPQDEPSLSECEHQEALQRYQRERYEKEQWEAFYQQQRQYKAFLQLRYQRLQQLQQQQNNNETINGPQESFNPQPCRPVSVSHERRKPSAFQSVVSSRPTQHTSYSQPQVMQHQQRQKVMSRQPEYSQAGNNVQQAMALDRAASRQQRQTEAEESVLLHRGNHRKTKTVQRPHPYKLHDTNNDDIIMDTVDEDQDMDMNDNGHDIERCSSPDDLSINEVKRKTGKEKPRWSIGMREALFNAVIAQKGLTDMASFDWAEIGRQIGRSGKACKDQWRRALLPKLQQSFGALPQHDQDENPIEEVETSS
ncbi:MAG: hypothetical protein EXX96DRAFT_638934 [Benjaminiella poitrasii]|nr:MAG: hypothetical protein EXX96DRAFT_638934 [Benjaminiella poitrasii]